MDLMRMRRSLLTPHIATASGSVASFSTDMKAPLQSCVVSFEPVQAGSGDPSPENVRPITGWTGVQISHSGADTGNPTVIAFSWQSEAGTVYGGYVDPISGVLTVDRAIAVLTGNEAWTYNKSHEDLNNWYFYTNDLSLGLVPPLSATDPTTKISSHYQSHYVSKNNAGKGINVAIVQSQLGVTCRPTNITPASSSTKPAWIAYLQEQYENGTPVQIVYKIAAPLTYQLTLQQIKTLIGTNNLWSDTNGSITVKYWTH